MRKLSVLLIVLTLLAISAVPVIAQDSTELPSPDPTSMPDLPPGTGGNNFDIVEWLTWVAGPPGGVLAAWFLEKTRLNGYIGMLAPEARRNVALIISGAFGVAACGLLSLIADLPAGSVAVINALLAMVFAQITHGRMVLSNDAS